MGTFFAAVVVFGAMIALYVAADRAETRAKAAETEFAAWVDRLRDSSPSVELHREFLQWIQQRRYLRLTTKHSEIAYATALDCVEQKPASTPAKTFALEVGRWHFAKRRGGSFVTQVDEQTMQNDIMVRSQSMMAATN
ncbi:MAG TPA: hypothetical protein VND64_20070 [Pirellulales bacterium]|nr:hypothetical protein [Pirellulales bacterium]